MADSPPRTPLANLGPGRGVPARHGLPDTLSLRGPLLLPGLAAAWPARRRWQLDALAERYPSHPVPVFPVRDRTLTYDTDSGMRPERVPLATFAARVRAATDADVGFAMLHPGQWLPEAMRDLPLPRRIRQAAWSDVRMTIAPPGALTPVHREFFDNLFLLVEGEKEVGLLAPEHGAALSAHGWLSGVPHMSPVGPLVVDTARHAQALGCEIWRCRLQAGDVLFIPRGWWHVFHTTRTAVGAGMWWANGPRALAPLAGGLYKWALNVGT